jgi:hypothetical protein
MLIKTAPPSRTYLEIIILHAERHLMFAVDLKPSPVADSGLSAAFAPETFPQSGFACRAVRLTSKPGAIR